MFSFLNQTSAPTDLLTSKLLDEDTFYPVFIKDLGKCQSEVIIESPFITARRMSQLLPTLKKLKSRKVKVIINTRNPQDHGDDYMRSEAHRAIASMQSLGIQVVYTGSHHRKIVILDRKVLYEGSLNVLSQNNSCEIMRRIESVELAWQMTRFIKIDKFLN